jgi:hypothetical protein
VRTKSLQQNKKNSSTGSTCTWVKLTMERDVFKKGTSRCSIETTTTTTSNYIKKTAITLINKIIIILHLYDVVTNSKTYTILSTTSTYRSRLTSGPELARTLTPLLKTKYSINNTELQAINYHCTKKPQYKTPYKVSPSIRPRTVITSNRYDILYPLILSPKN